MFRDHYIINLRRTRTLCLETLNFKTKLIVFTVLLISVLKGNVSGYLLNVDYYFYLLLFFKTKQRQVRDGKTYY